MQVSQIENKDSNYYKLRKEALSWVEKLSGKNWTDYNPHDPGITILEALCYVLTEIEYKSKFPMEEILSSSSGIPREDILTANALYPAELIFPTFPVTLQDFRIKLIDELEGVRNVWVKSPGSGYQKHKIIIELAYDAVRKLDKEDVVNFLRQNHLLGWQIDEIKFIRSRKYELHGNIYLNSEASPEKILAGLLYTFNEKLVNIEPDHHSLSSLMADQVPLQEIFDGPYTKNGFILKEELQDLKEQLDLISIKHQLMENNGVDTITGFGIGKPDGETYTDIFPINNDLPYLAPGTSHPVKIYQENRLIEIDKEDVAYQYGKIMQNLKREYRLKGTSTGTFGFSKKIKKRQLDTFHRLSEDLPTIYKISNADQWHTSYLQDKELNNSHLKKFLLPFEQVMANAMKTIAEVGQYYSVETPSFFYDQKPIKDPEIPLEYRKVREIDFLKKRNKVLDHLLGRFGIRFDRKVHDLFYDRLRLSLWQQVKCKALFLKHIPALTSGATYTSEKYKDKISYLELEILLRLWISDIPQKPFYKALSDYEFSIYKLNDNGQVIGQHYLEDYYDHPPYWKEYWFYTRTDNPIASILKAGMDRRNYSIEKTGGHHQYSVCLQTGETHFKNIIYRTRHKQKAHRAIHMAVKKFYRINKKSEGFYLLDHSRITNPELYKLHTVTFIFPAWSARFQSPYFQKKVEQLIYTCLPAYFKIHFLWLDHPAMEFLETRTSLAEKAVADEITFSKEIVAFIKNNLE